MVLLRCFKNFCCFSIFFSSSENGEYHESDFEIVAKVSVYSTLIDLCLYLKKIIWLYTRG